MWYIEWQFTQNKYYFNLSYDCVFLSVGASKKAKYLGSSALYWRTTVFLATILLTMIRRRPNTLYPCQHRFCRSCVNTQVLKGKSEGKCTQCNDNRTIEGKNIKESTLLLTVIKIVDLYSTYEVNSSDDIQKIERKIAKDLFDQNMFFSCHSCEQPFDRHQRQPFVVCQNQHILCNKCIKAKKPTKCFRCHLDILKRQNLVVMKVVLHASEFIARNSFSKKVQIIINENKFNLTIQSDLRVKDIFFYLQECKHISNQLEIKLCKFYSQSQESKGQRVPIDITDNIGHKIKVIVVEYDQRAQREGSKVTMPSKIITDLPIKINNFQPINLMAHEIQHEKQEVMGSEQFGVKYFPQPSQFCKKSNIYPEIQKKEKSNVYPVINSKVIISEVEKSMIKASQSYKEIHQEQRQMKSAIKQSLIPPHKELPPGTAIPKEFLQNMSTRMSPFGRKEVLDKFIERHEVDPKDQQFLCYSIQKTVNKSFQPNEIQTSEKMEKQIYAKACGGDRLSLILCLLKAQLQDGKIEVAFTPHSTIRSKLSLKIITSHYLSDRFIIKQNVEEDSKWYFEKMYESEKQFQSYVELQKRKYANRFGISEDGIVVHNLVKGGNLLTFSTNEGHMFCQNVKHNTDKDIDIEPFFKQLELSPEDFDSKGQIKFPDNGAKKEFRGNWPYYQPITSVRYGIKVMGLFDNGSNEWLRMNGSPGEWAVGFHGVRNPNQAYKHYKNVIKSILAGLQKQQSKILVVQNSKQAYSEQKCVNYPGQEVGSGVYFNPMFADTLPYTQTQKVENKQYRLVFQCRVNPQEIRIPENNQNFWVVRNPAAIRPYGIVLIEEQKAQIYPSATVQFKETFKYSNYCKNIVNSSKKNTSSAITK